MKIVLVVSSMETGGAERVAAVLSSAWAARSDSVTLVVTYSKRGSCFYPISEKVNLIFLADRMRRDAHIPLGFAAKLAELRRIFVEAQPDVIVSFLTNVNIAAILASRGLNIPVVVCEHNDPAADGRSLLWRLLCRLVYPQASALTFLSESIATAFCKGREGVIPYVAVVPNPLPEELLGVAKPRRGSGRKRLISVGRLHPQKQYGLLIDAFAKVADEFDDWDLWIWGEGAERSMLTERIAELHLASRVYLPGKTQAPWDEMVAADAFVLSSRFEGMPMALMESMALGVPAVAFDCRSGPRELMRDGRDGLLIPPGDAGELAAALRRLLSDRALREELGSKGARSIRERYSVVTILAVWDQLFAQLRIVDDSTGAR
ncbi:MAG TPA: glycosyltransferase family 4 protein [Trinickia sp.]|jgi:glycosyltransferase involved in cell wall biosynthesis|uniref:glycosyltransferase family 4 protein n=1 Tax=Trinickia sp. TaxID=2571163 RepID=UPI002B60DDAC|nr:glycosyltransferase family 4 protein [Trinickia sp.]HTI17758.1 glycosyltransferase family 4 protein [Trinickia sp.]